MKKSFSLLPTPVIVGSTRFLTVDEVVSDISAAEKVGADAFTVNIQMLKPQYQNYNSFRKIAEATQCPVMAINYRTEGGPNDEHRIEIMREAVRAGFSSVDIPMYLYDDDTQSSLSLSSLPFVSANPKEVSMRPTVIEKQKKVISEFKEMGAEVLMSAHVWVELSSNQAVSLGVEIESRGADIAKIVASCNSKSQQIEILQTNSELKSTLDIPFVYTGYGEYSPFVRLSAPLFGTMLVFCNHKYTEFSVREMPLISVAKEFYTNLK